MTSEFARCMDILLEELHERRQALLQLLGEQDYFERMVHRRSTRAAISCGLLKGEIFVVA